MHYAERQVYSKCLFITFVRTIHFWKSWYRCFCIPDNVMEGVMHQVHTYTLHLNACRWDHCWMLPLITTSHCRPLTVLVYFLLLFVVVILLLNVLIAQVSETYTAVQSTARTFLLFHRSRFITRCERSTALWFLLWTFRWRRICSTYCAQHDVESQTNTEQRHPMVGWQSNW